MVRLSAILCTVLGSPLLVTLAARSLAQPTSDFSDPKRFAAIPRWYVTYAITVTGDHHWEDDRDGYPRHGEWRVKRSYRGRFVVDKLLRDYRPNVKYEPDAPAPQRGRYLGWIKDPDRFDPEHIQASFLPLRVSIDDEQTTTATEPIEGGVTEEDVRWTTWRGSGEGRSPVSVAVYVDMQTQVFSVAIPYHIGGEQPRPVRWAWGGHVGKHEFETQEEQIGLDTVNDPEPIKEHLTLGCYLVEGLPLPSGTNDLSGEVLLAGPMPDDGNGPNGGKVTVYAAVHCSPDPPAETELLLEPVDEKEYENWRPLGGHFGPGQFSEQAPGNTIKVRARLQATGGGEPKWKVRLISFKLVGVSKERGVCLNAPFLVSGNPDFDLKFLSENNPRGVLVRGDDRQVAEEVTPTVTESTAVVTAFDFGAYGGVQATATLDNGETLVGHLPDAPDTETLDLPRRAPGSLIAQSWKADRRVADKPDDADDEAVPTGDGNPGDGLTLYEEYRGVVEGGLWTETAPGTKDLFVVDLIGGRSVDGIGLFRKITGLAVHDGLDLLEVSTDRVINSNHSAGPHKVDQHAVLLTASRTVASMSEAVSRTGLPSTPKDIEHVYIGYGYDPNAYQQITRNGSVTTRDTYARAIAHELLHCCCVWHHGEGDRLETWELTQDASGNPVITTRPFPPPKGGGDGPALQIKVLLENGQPAPVAWLEFGPGGKRLAYVGAKHGEHSGFEDCVMRYRRAVFYGTYKDPAVRYYSQTEEVAGDALCRVDTGTGVNDPGHPPESRHSFAAPGRGKCANQICVNDAAEPADRNLPDDWAEKRDG